MVRALPCTAIPLQRSAFPRIMRSKWGSLLCDHGPLRSSWCYSGSTLCLCDCDNDHVSVAPACMEIQSAVGKLSGNHVPSKALSSSDELRCLSRMAKQTAMCHDIAHILLHHCRGRSLLSTKPAAASSSSVVSPFATRTWDCTASGLGGSSSG